jgi:hypothetical protein
MKKEQAEEKGTAAEKPLMSDVVKLSPGVEIVSGPRVGISTQDLSDANKGPREGVEPRADWKVTGPELASDDKSTINLYATPAELHEFAERVRERRKREASEPPRQTYWYCDRCRGRSLGAASDTKHLCFRCNPMLSPSGQHMRQLTTKAEIAWFLEQDRLDREAYVKARETARRIIQRRREEEATLRKAGMA